MAEARKLGHDFDTAWPRAIEAVNRNDRAILPETRSASDCEYEGRNSYGGNLMAAPTVVLDLDNGQRDQRIVAWPPPRDRHSRTGAAPGRGGWPMGVLRLDAGSVGARGTRALGRGSADAA